MWAKAPACPHGGRGSRGSPGVQGSALPPSQEACRPRLSAPRSESHLAGGGDLLSVVPGTGRSARVPLYHHSPRLNRIFYNTEARNGQTKSHLRHRGPDAGPPFRPRRGSAVFTAASLQDGRPCVRSGFPVPDHVRRFLQHPHFLRTVIGEIRESLGGAPHLRPGNFFLAKLS
jgi:hypothetical protein